MGSRKLEFRLPGVVVKSEWDGGTCSVIQFALIKGMEEEAVRALLEQVKLGAELGFSDPTGRDPEGVLSVQSTLTGLEWMWGGHGHSGQWTEVQQEEVERKLVELAPFNMGDYHSENGIIRIKKVV